MRAISNIVYSGGGFETSLTVTCDENFIGETLTFTDGTKTLEQTVSSSLIVIFNIPNGGTWTLTNSLTPDVETFDIPTSYTKTLYSIPDGKTVLPTDDIQIWLKCAGINDKSYTTLAEVLADTDTLSALIASPNAVDYMVRSTTWIYAPKLVPTMTDNTHPSGVASASSSFSGLYPYYAFDGTTSTWWASASSGIQYIRYKFDTPTIINRVCMNTSQMTRASSIVIQASNDGNTWTSLKTLDRSAVIAHDQQDYYESITNDTAYLYYQIYMNTTELGISFKELNYFNSYGVVEDSTAMSYIGLNNYCANTLLADSTWENAIWQSAYRESVLNAKVPKMTSNTTPSGVCSASSVFENNNNYAAWKAFDQDGGSAWISNVDTSGALTYKFTEDVRMIGFTLKVRVGQHPSVKNFSIKGSNDGSTWETIQSYQLTDRSTSVTEDFKLTNNKAYLYYRMDITSTYQYNPGVNILQYYGREDV